VPWRGYFDFIDDVDVFVFHDDIQYTKGDWRNRNKIKTDRGTIWLTVPVNYGTTGQLICDTSVDYSQQWGKKHSNQLQQWYGKAPFYAAYRDEFAAFLSRGAGTISELNISLTRWVMDKLGIRTPTHLSSEFHLQGTKTERLLDLMRKIGATSYLSGPTAKGYLDEGAFREHGFRLEYKRYDYPAYPQLWGAFVGEVSALDLLFNAGADARNYLKSRSPNEAAVP
jgi:hypothetical protein